MKARLSLLCAFVCLIASQARADTTRRVDVEVVDIAAGNAYLGSGTKHGLRPGARVLFGKRARNVLRASHSFAVVEARGLRVGNHGVAIVRIVDERAPERLPVPRDPAEFLGMWPEVALPATHQSPTPVPLGKVHPERSTVDASLGASGAVILPVDGETDPVGRGDLRARLHVPIGQSFAVSADLSAQCWLGRYATGVASGDPRPWWRVRMLTLALGRGDGVHAELGRIPYAATNLGPIDGARVEAVQWGALKLAAFGGALPDPIDGRAAVSAGRFGIELGISAQDLALRPSLSMVVQGSVFEGVLDERRLYAQGRLSPGEHHLSAYAETSAFDADNPWRRPRAELTAAGVEADLRFSAFHVGARLDARKPERSYWLAGSFPQTWLCASASEFALSVPCTGASDDTRYVVQGFSGFTGQRTQLDVGGSWAGSSQRAIGQHALGYGTLRLVRIRERYDLSLGASQEGGTLLLSSTALRTDLGMALFDERMHLSLYYRPAYRLYQASLAGLWEQGAGMNVHAAPTPALSLDLQGDMRIGDVDMVMLMLSMLYRLGL
jgi:hypothetical protein